MPSVRFRLGDLHPRLLRVRIEWMMVVVVDKW